MRKFWHFVWEDDSIWSWIVNIILAFLVIKFIFYPVLGGILGTTHPVVAVISGSMEHNAQFDRWFDSQRELYAEYNISKERFTGFIMKNGFNTGDLIVLTGVKPYKVNIGDVIVFRSGGSEPIIHRVIKISNISGYYEFQTKGDNNLGSSITEMNIGEEEIVGRAGFRIPLLGNIKIVFTDAIKSVACILDQDLRICREVRK